MKNRIETECLSKLLINTSTLFTIFVKILFKQSIMKQLLKICFLLTIIFSSCSEQKEDEKSNKIVFDLLQAQDLDLPSASLLNKQIVQLATSDLVIIPAYSNLIINENQFILYSQMTNQIFRFNSDGSFINFIGKKGNGPAEFVEMNDILIDNNTIEVLDRETIVRYRLNGEFIEKVKTEIPAFSFAIADNGYWFYVSDNPAYSQFRLIETNREFTNHIEHLPIRNRSMPLIEDNFSKNGTLTFRESLSPTLYTLDNGLINSLYIDFGSLQVSEETLSATPEEVFERMDNSDYAAIRKYMDNREYAFLHVMITKPNIMEPEMFYWIIDKKSHKEKLIRVQDFAENSYLLFPQLMTDNNIIYFLGYDVANSDEWIDEDSNPSIVGIGVEELFEYKE